MITPRKVIIIGGLGNGSVIAAAIKDAGVRGHHEWSVAGYLNDRRSRGEDLEGRPVLGGLAEVGNYLKEDYFFIYTIYRIDGRDRRIALFESLNISDERLATFVHPDAYVACNVELGRGCLVMMGSAIGHNSEIGNYCHSAAQSCLGAYLKIGNGVHIGLNASVRENLTLGDCSTLAMGGVLLHDMGAFEIWSWVPAGFLRKAKKEL